MYRGDENVCEFADISDPKISEYLYKNGWGEAGLELYEINLPDKFGNAWNL